MSILYTSSCLLLKCVVFMLLDFFVIFCLKLNISIMVFFSFSLQVMRLRRRSKSIPLYKKD